MDVLTHAVLYIILTFGILGFSVPVGMFMAVIAMSNVEITRNRVMVLLLEMAKDPEISVPWVFGCLVISTCRMWLPQ